jgi:hypothetical protein
MQREKPIIFSTPMVRAILEGRKTQTRRIAKEPCQEYLKNASGMAVVLDGVAYNYSFVEELGKCPYGKPGDRLWVRETWGAGSRPDPFEGSVEGIEYRADEAYLDAAEDLPLNQGDVPDGVELCDYIGKGWKPSIHMPRWASRILLEITDIRVERLQSISDDDAKAEGWPGPETELGYPMAKPVNWFNDLWVKINGPDSWNLNTWVWVISFRRIDQQEASA